MTATSSCTTATRAPSCAHSPLRRCRRASRARRTGASATTARRAQLGLEATPDAYVQRLVAVYREVRRVLRDDGTLWLNLGDSYVASMSGAEGQRGAAARQSHIDGGVGRAMDKSQIGLAAKNLVGIPWRVAFALQADGWVLRSDVVWSKPNPMPESVPTGRPKRTRWCSCSRRRSGSARSQAGTPGSATRTRDGSRSCLTRRGTSSSSGRVEGRPRRVRRADGVRKHVAPATGSSAGDRGFRFDP